jgi:hypothetical protein
MNDPRLKLLDLQWFAANFLWIRDKYEHLRRLEFNRVQADFHLKRTGRDIIEKCRQCGLTTYMLASMFHAAITRPQYHGLIGSRNRDKAQENLQRVELFLRYLPPELTPRIDRQRVDLLTFPDLDSSLSIEAMQEGFGSGSTYSEVYMTELVYAKHARAALEAVSQAIPVGFGSIVLDSHYDTGIVGSFFEAEIQRAKRGESGYKHFCYPWQWEYDEAWAQEKRKDGAAAFAAQYCCDPTQAGDPIFPKAEIVAARANWKQPDLTAFDALKEQRDTGKLSAEDFAKAWEVERGKHRFLIGLDPAEGRLAAKESRERDYHALVVLHLPSGAQVDEWHSRCHLDLVPREADAIANKWTEFGDVILGVERNNTGHAVLKGLKEIEGKPYRLYRSREDGEYGWRTTAATKPGLLTGTGSLAEALRTGAVTLKSEMLADELIRFQYTDRGGMEAQTGHHDDLVMALALAWRMRSEGRIEAW